MDKKEERLQRALGQVCKYIVSLAFKTSHNKKKVVITNTVEATSKKAAIKKAIDVALTEDCTIRRDQVVEKRTLVLKLSNSNKG